MNRKIRAGVTSLLLLSLLAGCGSGGTAPAAGGVASIEGNVRGSSLQTHQVKVVPIDRGKGATTLPGFQQGVLLAAFMGNDTNDRELHYAASLKAGTAAEGVTAFNSVRQRSVQDVRQSPRSRAQAVMDTWLRHRERQRPAASSAVPARFQVTKTRQVGERDHFFVSEKTGPGPQDFRKVRHPARLLAVTHHAYFYVDERFLGPDGRFPDGQALEQVIRYFEDVAIPVDARHFGDYPQPPRDVDGEPRVTVLFTRMYDGVVGYFDPDDVTKEPESNQRDMLYVGVEPFKEPGGINTVKATLIHELVHMIVHNYKVWQLTQRGQQALDENKYVDEGMAVVAEQLGGLGFPAGEDVSINYVFEFLEENPSAQLIDDGDDYLYGTGYLFVLYLMEQHGQDVLRKLVQSSKTGFGNIEQATGRRFAEVFRDWSIALYATGYSADPRYNFKTVKLRGNIAGKELDGLKVTPAGALPASEVVKAKPWSIIPVGFAGSQSGGTFSLNLAGSKGTGLEAVLLDTSTLRD